MINQAPLTTADMDVRDLDGFMLNVERLLASELWALTKEQPLAFRGAVGLWARAWKQIPPASLPNDEAVIAAFADMSLSKFRKLRTLVMRGFELCSDGRYYHRKLSEEVNKIWPSVAKKRRDRDADNERLKQWREKKKAERETGVETADETRFETEGKPVANGVDTDRDTDRDITSNKKDSGADAPKSEASEILASSEKPIKSGKRKPSTSIPDDCPSLELQQWALKHWAGKGRPDLCKSLDDEVQKFRDRCVKIDEKNQDWNAAWRYWCRNAIKFNKNVSRETPGGRHGGQSTIQSFGTAITEAVRERSGEGVSDPGGPEIIDITPSRNSEGDHDEETLFGRSANAA